MKAIAIDGFGGPEELRRRGLPTPEPRDDQVRLRVVNAGVSALDAAARRGELGTPPGGFPWVPGFEAAGVVDALGPACRRFRVGDRVWALLPEGGACAEFAVAREADVAAMPAPLLFEEAACAPLDGLAARHALSTAAADGATVRIRDGAGPAGHLAVQLALAAGLPVAIDDVDERFEFAAKLGAVEAWEAAGGGGPVLHCRAGAPAQAGDVDLSGGADSVQAGLGATVDVAEGLAALGELAVRRRFRPRLSKIFNITRAAEAHRRIESDPICGKLALAF